MSFLNELAIKAINDPYLETLISKLEKIYGYNFAGNTIIKLNGKEYTDLLRFSDILCRSDLTEARNLSYKIISLLYDFYSEDIFSRCKLQLF